jgi:hypothetical protein
VPVRYNVWGEFLAVSLIAILAVLVPTSLGVNVTLIVQLAPPASVDELAGHVLLVVVKSPASVPVIEMPEMVYELLSLLVRTAVRVALVVPTLCVPKSRLLGDAVIGAGVGIT